jgi:hypothetical protein
MPSRRGWRHGGNHGGRSKPRPYNGSHDTCCPILRSRYGEGGNCVPYCVIARFEPSCRKIVGVDWYRPVAYCHTPLQLQWKIGGHLQANDGRSPERG